MADPVADLTGTTVVRFTVRVRLGAGGMGEVYRADDTKLKRSVALKRMAPHLRADARYRQRFLKEAERASRLTDQQIAGLYDVLEEGGEIFLVMAYVEGETLRQRLQPPLPPPHLLTTAPPPRGAPPPGGGARPPPPGAGASGPRPPRRSRCCFWPHCSFPPCASGCCARWGVARCRRRRTWSSCLSAPSGAIPKTRSTAAA